jgi:hypothetical protein
MFNYDTYPYHLRRDHGFVETKARECYMPNKQFAKCWDPDTTCPVPDCSVAVGFATRNTLRVHLKNIHHYTNEQAALATIAGLKMRSYEDWLNAKRSDRRRTNSG